MARSGSFNPRPALGPGATPRLAPRKYGPKAFQSPPGPRAGRYAPRPAAWAPATRRFNPRPALGPGATSKARALAIARGFEFQSPPGPRAGRYVARLRGLGAVVGFQSPPGPRAGRYVEGSRPRHRQGLRVSIPARPSGRALLYKPPTWGARRPIIVDCGATCHAQRCLRCRLIPSICFFCGKKVRGSRA